MGKYVMLLIVVSLTLAGMAGASVWVRPTVDGPGNWNDPANFLGQADGAPGPGVPAAQWLIDRGVRVAGAETIAFEVIRPGEGHATLPVHRMLLVEAGIHIIEAMNLTDLSEESTSEFLFIGAPLKITGGTGSPMRPLAVIDG